MPNKEISFQPATTCFYNIILNPSYRFFWTFYFLFKVIKKRKAEISQKVDANNDFKPILDQLLDMEKIGALTVREVQEEVDSFTFAGSDTVSITLTILLLIVGSYTEVQMKIVEE